MKIIKLTTPWPHDYKKRTPLGKGVFDGFQFEIDNQCSECDYWVVWGGLKRKTTVKCPPENVIYITDEAHAERFFNHKFLQQFPTVFSSRFDVNHPNVIRIHDVGIWHFNKSFDEVATLLPFKKDKTISVVSSDLTWLPGHKKRFAFVNKLMGHYKNQVEFYGRGINPIENKFNGIAPFKYSVAIENSYIENYFTEKIFECFLTYTLPIYYGCPNLEKFFDERAFVRIDIDEFDNALDIIDCVVKEDVYQEKLPYIKKARELFLNRYYFFPAVVNLIASNFNLSKDLKRKKVGLLPEEEFLTSTTRKIINKVKPLISKTKELL